MILKNPERVALVKRYAVAAAHLYGTLTVTDFLYVFNHYEDEKLSREEAMSILQEFPKRSVFDVKFADPLIANWCIIIAGQRDVQRNIITLNRIRGIPLYLPSKYEFLSYEDYSSFDAEEAVNDLGEFIISNNILPQETIDGIYFFIMNMYDRFALGIHYTEIVDLMGKHHFNFKTEELHQLFLEKAKTVFRQTRRYVFRGHKIDEYVKIYHQRKKAVQKMN
ncbi:MAG: hypothetical protein WC225_02255 [Acholeplasmataceae bacterium]|nr:hypothetical protein [Acholeplasmataceae bacterium]